MIFWYFRRPGFQIGDVGLLIGGLGLLIGGLGGGCGGRCWLQLVCVCVTLLMVCVCMYVWLCCGWVVAEVAGSFGIFFFFLIWVFVQVGFW